MLELPPEFRVPGSSSANRNLGPPLVNPPNHELSLCDVAAASKRRTVHSPANYSRMTGKPDTWAVKSRSKALAPR